MKDALGSLGLARAVTEPVGGGAPLLQGRFGLYFGTILAQYWVYFARCCGVRCEKADIAENVASEAQERLSGVYKM